MKRPKFDSSGVQVSRLKSFHLVMGLVFVYFFLLTSQIHFLLGFFNANGDANADGGDGKGNTHVHSRLLNENPRDHAKETEFKSKILSNLVFKERVFNNDSMYNTAMHAWKVGSHLWAQLSHLGPSSPSNKSVSMSVSVPVSCPEEVSASGRDVNGGGVAVRLPCGMTLGSHVTVVGKPRGAHPEKEPKISLVKDVMVSQFMIELRRERVVHGEEPVRLLHFNPRIRGDWSEKPVIEMNNCYRGQWGAAVRCEGWRSPPTEETVDGQVKCENWLREDTTANHLEESKASLWLTRLMGRKKKIEMDWPYAFQEDKFFVLTVNTGLEGYHISVNGRHITSFAYRNGFDLEDAMVLHVFGDVDVRSVFAASLPTSHPSASPERHLEMLPEWKARPIPREPIVLFVGVISAGDHFAERMAVRKSWMRHPLIRSSAVVARFFVALHVKEAINKELKKEAEYFGDIVIVPYLDNYDLVVLKTLAICEYGVNSLSTKYIMKCDDDTFVRVDAVIEEASIIDSEKSIYLGKLNYYHKPLRSGKWAVKHEEWLAEAYPPYADGPGYVISSDIARFITTEFEKNRLRLFKMEDVSMGMWIEQFNSSRPVAYVHNEHFHQSGCQDDYYTAHYQSPKQLICLWERLQIEGKARCCNLR